MFSTCPPHCTAKPEGAPFCVVHCASTPVMPAIPCGGPSMMPMPPCPTMSVGPGAGMMPGMMMPIMGGGMGMGMGGGMPMHYMDSPGFYAPAPPPKADRGKKDEPTEDEAPWQTDYWGQPMAPADDKSAAKAYMHQVLNCPYPLVDQGIHSQIKFLVDSKCKGQVKSACKRFLGCGGVYSLRTLEILQHLPDDAMIDMLDSLGPLSDPSKCEWHFNNGRIITLAHQHKKRGEAAKEKDAKMKWDEFAKVVGRPKITWPAPPEPIGWSFEEMYPLWDGEKKNVPSHMMQVLIPKYYMGMGGGHM